MKVEGLPESLDPGAVGVGEGEVKVAATRSSTASSQRWLLSSCDPTHLLASLTVGAKADWVEATAEISP